MHADCIEWPGAVNSKGYGTRTIGGRGRLAHRVAYEEVHGPLSPAIQLHHICRNRTCINPAHLRPATSLAHNRAHLAEPSVAERVEQLLSDGASRTRQALLAAFPVQPAALDSALWRLTTGGRIARASRARYVRA